jgi:2-polyprenyl-3-methyl-5-hydroxy-6-metoxy-1,4-benzoquinol methylase
MGALSVLKNRSYDPELLDLPGFDPVLARQGYRFMAFVNRLFGGVRTVRQFVAKEAGRTPAPHRPLRVLDIGAGVCDIPIAVARWARRQGIDVRFTCLEISPHAPAIARRKIERAELTDRVQLRQEDAFAHQPDQPYDCAVGSMFFHHLKEDQILAMVGHLRGFVRRSVLVNDLGRNWPDYLGAWLLTLPLPRGVRHDALLSVRRSFTPAELETLLRQLPEVTVEASRAWLFRVKAVVRFIEGGAS